MMVLLNVAFTKTIPAGTVRANFFFTVFLTGAVVCLLVLKMPYSLRFYYVGALFLPATVFLGPLRVRALVLVLWPRQGRPARCLMPL